MGHLGRITSVKDLPSRTILKKYIREAMKLTDEGQKIERKAPAPKQKQQLVVPDDFAAALRKNKLAQSQFNKFTYSARKEYLQWITEAKTQETRNKRMTTALQWIEEGKGRNWKYERK